jgi:hypothetical protein
MFEAEVIDASLARSSVDFLFPHPIHTDDAACDMAHEGQQGGSFGVGTKFTMQVCGSTSRCLKILFLLSRHEESTICLHILYFDH